MRTGTISIDGQKHLLCFSLRVVKICTERYGSTNGLFDALSEGDELKRLDESVWLLSQMMAAGDKYAKKNGIKNPSPMSYDDLYDVCDIRDFSNLRASIIQTINNGRETTVDVETNSPNAKATLGE